MAIIVDIFIKKIKVGGRILKKIDSKMSVITKINEFF